MDVLPLALSLFEGSNSQMCSSNIWISLVFTFNYSTSTSNIATGETSQAITSLDYFHFFRLFSLLLTIFTSFDYFHFFQLFSLLSTIFTF